MDKKPTYADQEEFSEAVKARLIPPRFVGWLDLKLGTNPGLVLSWAAAGMKLVRRYRQVRGRLSSKPRISHDPS
jgi:hypothetical protein